MKRMIILALAAICCTAAFAQERNLARMKALSFGIGFPFECRDLPGMGTTFNIGYDCAYPLGDKLGLGFYVTGGGGFWSEFKKYDETDHTHAVFRVTAGLMLRIGDVAEKPWLVGVAPCTGFGLYDMDMVLPIEVRFGRYLTKHWYIMGELTYHISLAGETATIEPAIRAGYNFGYRGRKK